MASLATAVLADESDEDDGDFVPQEEEEDELEYDEGEAGDEGMGKAAKGKDSAPAKRKAPAAGIAGRKRAKGGIYLSDSDDEMPQPRIIEDETAAGEEEEEGAREQEGKNEVEEKAPTKADDFFASMKQDSKPKSKADDFLAQMMSGKVEKKAPSAMVGGPGGALAGIMSGLVSARPSSGAGGSSLAKSSSISNVASMFPKTVEKKETLVIKELREFAGEKVMIEKKVEVGSEEHSAMMKKVGTKSNLDNLLDKLSGKNKNITTLRKTEHDWGKFKEKEGIEDELSTYRKDGYVEKMSFLARSDARLDEILRDDRKKEREARKPTSGGAE